VTGGTPPADERSGAAHAFRPALDYDGLAASYDGRYRRHDYGGIERALRALVEPGARVLEVGCGTGRWLELLAAEGCAVLGVDPSMRMLERAADRCGAGVVVRGAAEALPFRDGSFDLVLVVNALHHFVDPRMGLSECARVLAPAGRFLTIGLDPSQGRDRWWVYDYFPGTLERDRRRYPHSAQIRAWLDEAGVVVEGCGVVQEWREDEDARAYVAGGGARKDATSQLVLLTDEEYAAGRARLEQDLAAAEAKGRTLRIRGALRLYGTRGRVPASDPIPSRGTAR